MNGLTLLKDGMILMKMDYVLNKRNAGLNVFLIGNFIFLSNIVLLEYTYTFLVKSKIKYT